MSSWDYLNGVPFIPVKIYGKDVAVSSLALVDTGAKYCVLHGKLTRALGLKNVGEEPLRGFGGRTRFQAGLVTAEIEVAGRKHNVTLASVSDVHFPMVAPKIVLGRNLLNLFRLTLDGPNRKVIVDI